MLCDLSIDPNVGQHNGLRRGVHFDIFGDEIDACANLFDSLLAPIGQHRKLHVVPSKGKRSNSRKRKLGKAAQVEQSIPPAPAVSAFVDVGLARITKVLEQSASQSQVLEDSVGHGDGDEEKTGPPPTYSVVFIARSGQPSAFNNHFPQMVAVAADSHRHNEPIRLVGFSKSCEERLSACLGIPRASSVALREGAPQSKPLVDFVRQHVSPIEVAWLKEAREADFLATKIKSVQTTVGAKRQKKG